MLTRGELDQRYEERARVLKAQAVTPQHSACEAAEDADAAERRRRRVQHEADPYPVEAPEVVEADLDKVYRQASDAPTGYPPMVPVVSPEDFRKGPITADHAAYGPGYQPPAYGAPVPSAALTPAMITRPLLEGGQSRPCAPEAC